MKLLQFMLLTLVRLYQWVLSPMKTALFGPGARCRFTPTCSQYAIEALREHGPGRGTWLAARRVCRCHPWGGGGLDPVPRNTHLSSLSPSSSSGHGS